MSTNNMIARQKNDDPFDFYETPDYMIDPLVKVAEIPKDADIVEPCCGNWAIVKRLRYHGYKNVWGFDIQSKDPYTRTDFLKCKRHDDFSTIFMNGTRPYRYLRFIEDDERLFPETKTCPDIVLTNPPYGGKRGLALQFVKKALEVVKPGGRVIMLLPMNFYETSGRYEFICDNPPRRIWSFSNRPDMTGVKSGMRWFAWFEWVSCWYGKTIISPIWAEKEASDVKNQD